MKMKKVLLSAFLVSALALSKANAQVNIGSTAAPDASAALQISGTNLGFIPPQIALSNTTTFGLANNTGTPSMLVYNSNATVAGTVLYPSFGQGLYMWDGTGWLWQAPKPSIITPAGNQSVAIPESGSDPINVEVPISAPVSSTGSPSVLPTVENNVIVFHKAGTYQIELGGVVGHNTVSSPAPTPSTGYINLNLLLNGTSAMRYQNYLRDGVPLWFNYVWNVEVAAGDKISMGVTSNTTGFIVPFVRLTSVKVEFEGTH